MSTRSRSILFAVLALAALTAFAEDKKATEVTLKGEVVDLACYLEDGKRGATHEKCAKSCIKGGTPAGLLMEDGSVVLIVLHGKDGREVLDLAAHSVELTGYVYERGGLKGLIVKKVKDLGLVKEPEDIDGKDGEGSEGSHKDK